MDKKFRVPRVWSNHELKKFARLFHGSVVNVSGWADSDKEGAKYRDYFANASEYWITNYKPEARGFQGDQENEIFLDLTTPLPEDFPRYDVVFNHTVLEHIFEVNTAFCNLCSLSNDIVITVVPFLQEQHADYGDYWRFTPLAVDKLFKQNGLNTIYINANDHADASVYVFAIASRHPEMWKNLSAHTDNILQYIYQEKGMIGRRIIKSPALPWWLRKISTKVAKLR